MAESWTSIDSKDRPVSGDTDSNHNGQTCLILNSSEAQALYTVNSVREFRTAVAILGLVAYILKIHAPYNLSTEDVSISNFLLKY